LSAKIIEGNPRFAASVVLELKNPQATLPTMCQRRSFTPELAANDVSQHFTIERNLALQLATKTL
jgi:hypothetical protein